MCLYPRLLENPKYKPNKKNGGCRPLMRDPRTRFVPIACGQCVECRRAKANEWRVRLHEELKQTKYPYFITLTFSPESLEHLSKEYTINSLNIIAGKAIRLFLERVRKHTKKSIKHWLITELGQTNTERIHLHGIFFMEYPINNEWLEKMWKYGTCDTGQYCNSRTINYIIKYVTKIDTLHKDYKAQIFCSKGLGSNYIDSFSKIKHRFNEDLTKEYYTLPNGHKVALPIYYRNKLWDEEQREKLWLHKIEKDIRYINGIKLLNASNNQERLIKLIKKAQQTNKEIGFGDLSEAWKKKEYNITLKMLQKYKN